MRIETQRLLITDFTPDMAEAVSCGSQNDDMRRFLPDEVFETPAIAAEVIADLIDCYGGTEGPFVHPMLAQGQYAGYVQLVPMEDGEWELGYCTVQEMTGRGYATEAVRAFLPVIMAQVGITRVMGVCLAENLASIRVLEKCGFRRVFEGDGLYQGEIRPLVKMIYSQIE